MNVQCLVTIGILLILIGFIALTTGILLSSTTSDQSSLKGGAIIFIGPIPIAFGTDRNSLLIVSLLMMVLMVIAYFLLKH